MLEGQDGLNWERWQRVARIVEDNGFAGLYRSDHFTNPNPPDLDSLELWTSLTWLASHTNRIEFGPMVSPVSFRDPIFTARIGKDVDTLSNGRLILGMGAGWQVREHEMFNYPLLEKGPRFDRFEEAVEVVYHLLRDEGRVNFSGNYYKVSDGILLPRPLPGGPRILLGGTGEKRTLPLVARFADEWNGVYVSAQRWGELNTLLNSLMEKEGRAQSSVRRSAMVGAVFGKDDASYQRKIAKGIYGGDMTRAGVVAGTATEFAERVAAYREAGVERLLLQWIDWETIDEIEDLAKVLH